MRQHYAEHLKATRKNVYGLRRMPGTWKKSNQSRVVAACCGAIPLLLGLWATGCESIANTVDANLNLPPTADAGFDLQASIGQAVKLDGLSSSDPNDDPLTYQWQQRSGPFVELDDPDSARTTFTPLEAGDYEFLLAVSDGRGGTDRGSVWVIVEEDEPASTEPNHPPVANAGLDQMVAVGEDVKLDGGGSYDPDGDELRFSWIQATGPAVVISDRFSPQLHFIAPFAEIATNIVFELTVQDDEGLFDSATVAISMVVDDSPGDDACIGVACDDGEICDPDTGECVSGSRCGDGVCDGGEDGCQCPIDCEQDSEAAHRFFTLIDEAKAQRPFFEVGTTEFSRSTPYDDHVDGGQRIIEFQDVMYERTKALTDLVMMDNTVGKIYPGSLLWADPVWDGQLHQLEEIPGRPPVTTSFTTLVDSESGPQPSTFETDGSFSDFIAHAAELVSNPTIGGTRIAADYKISSTLEDALLSIGLSASYWGGRMEAGLQHLATHQRSVAVMSLDQVFFSAAVDSPPINGFLPRSLIECRPQVAARLSDGAVAGGEVAYVRKVDYGRRILVALSAESSVEQLNAAVSVAVDFIAGNFQGEVDHHTLNAFHSVEGKLIVIGGSYPDGISQFFGGDFPAFVGMIQAIMSADYLNDTQGAVPISFELAYVDDNAPMQVFETVEFSGRIPLRSWGRVVKNETIRTTGQDAAVIRQDGEMHTDDWTLIELTSQTLSLSPDGRSVIFYVEWHAFEGESNQTVTHKTIIRSAKSFTFNYSQNIREIISSTQFGPRQQWYAGELHSHQQFPDHGLLSNVRVRFDGPGGQDQNLQNLTATLAYEIWLEE